VLRVLKKKNLVFFLAGLFFVLILFWQNGIISFAFYNDSIILRGDLETGYQPITEKNSETGYQIILEDDAGLLTEQEKTALIKEMQEITLYGNVAFVTIQRNEEVSTDRFIQNYYRKQFGEASGIVFLIDMDYRKIWIHSNGRIYQTVTSSYANIITDNVYTYASDREYYQCASIAFSQVLSLLKGEKIAQPMKYISNFCLAVVLAFLINYFIVMSYSKSKKSSQRELIHEIPMQFQLNHPKAQFIRQTKHYSPVSTRSSSSGGSSGGGGHSSGGGGGHSF